MTKFLFGTVATVLLGIAAWADNLPTKFYVWVSGTSTAYTIDSKEITFSSGSMSVNGTTYLLSNVDSITFTEPVVQEDPDTIYVTYNGTTASVSTLPSGVTESISGADVSLTSTRTDKEFVTVLSGSSTSGSFTYTGDYKTTVRLNGLTLKGSSEEAVHIKDGKRIALELADGTTNTLEDATTDGGQKGAFYTKGHLEISGGGTLNLKGNIKHGIASKEYMLIKKTAGTINVTGAATDGMHAGEYLQINGGTINISGVSSDGIQAEMVTPDEGETIEDNGKLIIKGGTISVTCTGDSADCLKSDSTLHITGGTITLTGKTGVAQKGMSSDLNVQLDGGTITINMSGNGGKGIKADAQFIEGDKDTNDGPTLKVTTSGSSSGSGSGGGFMPARLLGPGGGGGGFNPGGGGTQPGGGGTTSGSGSSKAIKAQGAIYIYGGQTEIYTSTNGAEGIESKTAIYIEGGKHYIKAYDDCINSSGCIYFNGGITVCYSTGNDAVDSNAGKTGAITIGNGTAFAYSAKGGAEEGFDCDNNSNLQITGTGIGISAGGAQGGGTSSSTISNAKQGYAFVTSSISYQTGRYYTLADASGNNLVTYSFDASCSSSLALFTATGMKSGSSYNVKYSTSAPTDATTSWHGLYLGSSATGTTSVTSFTAK